MNKKTHHIFACSDVSNYLSCNKVYLFFSPSTINRLTLSDVESMYQPLLFLFSVTNWIHMTHICFLPTVLIWHTDLWMIKTWLQCGTLSLNTYIYILLYMSVLQFTRFAVRRHSQNPLLFWTKAHWCCEHELFFFYRSIDNNNVDPILVHCSQFSIFRTAQYPWYTFHTLSSYKCLLVCYKLTSAALLGEGSSEFSAY